jgi:hypothetical protein
MVIHVNLYMFHGQKFPKNICGVVIKAAGSDLITMVNHLGSSIFTSIFHPLWRPATLSPALGHTKISADSGRKMSRAAATAAAWLPLNGTYGARGKMVGR